MPGRTRQFLLRVGTAAGMVVLASRPVGGQTLDAAPVSAKILTNFTQLWNLPAAEKLQPHRIRTEAIIYFYDPGWACAWGECDGQPTWLPIYDCGKPLNAGQRILVDGIVPAGQDHLDFGHTQIRVLQEGVPLTSEPVTSLTENPRGLASHRVELEGVITTKTEEPQRLVFNLQTLDARAVVRVHKNAGQPDSPLEPGDRVRVQGVYGPNFDKDGKVSEFNLWVAKGADMHLVKHGNPRQTQGLVAPDILTNLFQIWTLPLPERDLPHRIQAEMVIFFFDPEWRNAWGESYGAPTYLPIADCPTPLKAGERILIDGIVLPIRERFDWEKTQVRILDPAVPLKAEPVASLADSPRELKGRLIIVDGFIDRLLEDPTHVTISLLSGDTPAKAYVIRGSKNQPLKFKEGDFVRFKCVYSPQFNLAGQVSDLSLFIPSLEDIQVTGSSSTDPRFLRPVTTIDQIGDGTPTNNLIHVAGVVRNRESGKWVSIWDDTGQILVSSKQTQPLHLGERIEAVGYPYVAGVGQCLNGGFYRVSESTNTPALPGDPGSVLRLADRIRDLNAADARRHLRVNLRAIVTWAHGDTPFAYVQDASGGIRVARPEWKEAEARKPGTIVSVKGETCEGDFVPAITNATISRLGFWNLEEGSLVTLEQALTGVEDGHWVQMRGYVRQVTKIHGLVCFDLTTSSGEFKAWTPATQPFDSWKGSIVRVEGVCAALSNARHQLTGIQIWAPEVKYIQVEEAAPDDLFAAPLRPLESLRRFNSQNALNQRVRTSGSVVLQVPGRYLYVQEGPDSVLALSEQPDLLKPGDKVEVVGFPGNEGRRFVLRQAAYRRISSGPEPIPVQLSGSDAANSDLEGIVAKAEGVLLSSMNKEGEARLVIRGKESAFEASLNSTETDAGEKLKSLPLGSKLAATGVYEVQRDEYGNARSFVLRLRSWNDIQLLQLPSWWTLRRLLWVLAGVVAGTFLALIWGIVLSRKNALLNHAKSELQAAHDKLEVRVEARTRELQERTDQLQEQVVAKERARSDLAEAQRHLMLASRQAGMAEVATGVLHNVGNVLNSVNISVAMVREKINHAGNGNLDKVLDLLHQHGNDLGTFFTSNPKGQKLVEYLEILSRHQGAEKREALEELATLTQNVDHIKEIVAMQQSYAQASGVLELLDPAELAEDAIRMHAAAFQRHGVKLIREFSPVPQFTVDRHKVLQILTNLLHNAKYACEEKLSTDRQIILKLAPAEPNRIRFEVADNGVGITPENLTRIFSFGFTTRRNGHGFGLHSGALAARELGGSLSAHSPGVGHGAVFVLELPIHGPSESK